MATAVSMAIRRNNALQEIETRLKLQGDAALPRLHRDKEMLWTLQLEAIAAGLQPKRRTKKATKVES